MALPGAMQKHFTACRAQTTRRSEALATWSSLVRIWWPRWTAASCSGQASTGQSLCRWVMLVSPQRSVQLKLCGSTQVPQLL